MKLLRPMLAVLIVVSVAAMSPAQVIIQRPRHHTVTTPANPQALTALQQDLVIAISSMKSALPIYDGNRVHSIHAAHETLLIVDRAIYGAKTQVRQKPNVNDSVGSGKAKSKFTAQQISASQSSMRQGLQALQAAWKDLQTAAGSNPNKQAVNAANHLQTALKEANTAIAIHAAQG